ncbi:heme ABC transporter permease [Gallaecimonas kandeliae]|uniref:heme ABC transporter permease n=1 Tax=Gallaecimonas kandeliae TaxID=3029055 RepID=UPI00264809C5|nr:heme ABC transporter permease [Gallaecimonas kandeliae]WKE66770.1 heme ABC transporter permease [Gallaecimonas kandeliae]
MWSWLHPYAKPEKAYGLCRRLQPWLLWPALALLVLGSVWGLAFVPPDYQQGDSFRIIYLHVPTAMLGMGGYLAMAIAALVGLVWQQRLAELAIQAVAPVGAVFTFLSLFTGAVWGKPTWGTWWEWDARLTSQLILLFLYLGVMALYGAISDKRTAGRAAGLLALVGVVNLPIIHYSVQWWNTLHQGSTISRLDPTIDPSMIWPLLVNLAGFALLLGALSLKRMATLLLAQESRRPWVIKMLEARHVL